VFRRYPLLLLTAIVLSGCGSPAGPTPPQTTTANVVVFYDENGNGVLDSTELVRIPKATVTAGVASAQSDAAGRAVLTTSPGLQTLSVAAASLPPYYEVAPTSVTLPAAGDVRLAATLSIGTNRPNYYMAFGDSLTSDLGYPETLVDQLRGHFGSAFVQNEGASATRTDDGVKVINPTLASLRPAYTLVMYGTNDWNRCKMARNRVPCFTIDNLRYIVQGARGAGSLVFLATLPTVNVGYNLNAPPDRNEWVREINDYIRPLAQEEGVVLVDVHKAFLAESDQASLFLDHVHPSPKGTAIIVSEFFTAITQRQPGATGF
jgi:lysophospholipase L1-like esterase